MHAYVSLDTLPCIIRRNSPYIRFSHVSVDLGIDTRLRGIRHVVVCLVPKKHTRILLRKIRR